MKKEQSNMYTKVATFKVPCKESATKVLFNMFDHGSIMRSIYMVETKRGVTLVVHHEGWEKL